MTEPITRSRALWTIAVLVAASVPAIVLDGLVAQAVALHALAESTNPYWQPQHALLLYLGVPIVVLSGCVLVLMPGLLVALAAGSAKGIGEWILHGLAFSFLVLGFGAAIAHGVATGPVSRELFLAMVLATAVAAGAVLLARLKRGRVGSWPLAGANELKTLAPLLVAPAIVLALLTPKFLWENLNGDGAHAYEASRLLLTQALPFWNPDAGAIAFWPGTTSMLFTYAGSWFIQLFGPYEVSARLPVILYLVAVFAGVSALAEHARGRMLSLAEQWLVWLALLVYTVVVGFSATYSPYSADLALPGTQDTLLVVCFLGFVLAAARGSIFWLSLWGLLTFLTLPNGILLMAFWWVAMAVLWKPRPYRLLAALAAIGIGCVVLGFVLPPLLTTLGSFAPGRELKTGALLDRFNFLQLTDVRRLLFLIVPAGMLPALALFGWRKQDQLSRTITAVTLAYFGITYIQAYASLHYYIPAMLLPLAVFWRVEWVGPARRNLLLTVTALAGCLALWLSWPESAAPYTAARKVGATIEDRVGGYEISSAEQFRSTALLGKLFPYDWHPSVPERAHGGSVLTWNFYAHTRDRAPANYFLQRASDATPGGAALLASEAGFSLFVRDSATWAAHRALRPHSPAGARIYQIPRELLFRSGEGGVRIVEIKALLRRLSR